MHARKIALHRNSLIAIVMTLLVLGSALAIAGNSTAITPQKGTVTYHASYLGLPAIGATVTVSTLSGYQVTTLSGAQSQYTLPFGSYIFTLQPYVVNGAIVNGISEMVNVTSTSTQTVNLDSSAYATHQVAVTVSGASSGATVSFSTFNGFVFETNTTTGAFNASLPSVGFYATVTSGTFTNTSYHNGVGDNLALSTAASVSNLIGGFVSTSNDQPVPNFNIIAINTTANSYTVMPFTDGAFQFVKGAATNYVISANGYKPVDYQSGQNNYVLSKASSNVTYNYTLGNNPGYLNLTVTYNLGNSTAVPFLPNATVGSLYWQNYFDTFASQQPYSQGYVNGLVGNYSDYSILVNGFNYKQISTNVVTSATLTAAGFNAVVNYTFQNMNVTSASLAGGFSVKLFAQGTQYNTGSLFYNYNFNYNIPGLSLASPVSQVKTFVSPVKLIPQATSGFVNLVFNTANKPIVTASQINLFWNNTTPSNYLVASNSTSAVFIVPTNTAVSFNLSNAFYNPAVQDQTDNYAKALNYTWKLDNAVQTNDYNSYNATINFGAFANYTVTVQYTSSSNETNTTSFTVFAYNGAPSASLNVTSQGKTLFATQTVTGTQSISVPQSQTVQFSAYQSSLVIPGTSYNVPLLYNWYFPGYSNAAMNVTNTFDTPYVASNSLVTGYLNVATATGSNSNVTLSLKVLDTTPASPVVTLTNSTGASINQPVAGKLVVFSANKTTDKYYPQSQLTYSWKIVYANGTTVAPGNSTYELVNSNTNLSYFMVKFNTLNSLIVSLEVKNPSNVSAYKNFTASIAVDSPRLIVQSAYFPTTPAQGSKTLVYLNVSNNGTVNANSFYIVAFVNGQNVSFQAYGALPVGVTKQFEFNLTSPTSGNVQIVFKAVNSSQPSFFTDSGQLSVTQTVNAPSYQSLLIIGGVVAVIVVIGFVYYRLSSRGPSKPREKKQAPKQAPKKTEEKKK